MKKVIKMIVFIGLGYLLAEKLFGDKDENEKW